MWRDHVAPAIRRGLPGKSRRIQAPVGRIGRKLPMALVICDMSISLDGYVTGPNDSRENPFGDGAEMLHDWMFDAATADDRAILQEALDGCGAVVMGRKSFDKNEGDGGWGDGGPVGDTPCFVVTHNKPTTSHPSAYTFVTDGVVSAIEQAKNAAGDKVVGLHGATVMQQALPLGLVDEIRVHVIPVLLGGGTLLFGTLNSSITLERSEALVTPAATHLRFRVVR
jgi:dihydrofolate reductase